MAEVKPVRYEISKVFLKKMLRPEVVEGLNKILKKFEIPAIILIVVEDKEAIPIVLSHTSSENAEQGIVELEYPDPKKAGEIIKILSSLAEE